MKKVYTEKDIQNMLRAGTSLDTIPAGSVITPSAKDAINAVAKNKLLMAESKQVL